MSLFVSYIIKSIKSIRVLHFFDTRTADHLRLVLLLLLSQSSFHHFDDKDNNPPGFVDLQKTKLGCTHRSFQVVFPLRSIMATYAHNNFELYRPTAALSLDTKQKYFEEDDSSILDDNILDSSTLDMSPMNGRRESFADTASVFSSGDGTWGDIHIPSRQSANSTNPFFGQSNNPYNRAQHAVFGQQNGAWTMEGDSGTCTPTADYEAFGEYDNGATNSYMANGLPPTGSTIYSGLPTSHSQSSSVFSSGASAHASIPTSPHSGNEWMMSASETLDQRPIPKRMRPNSPSFRSNSPMMRRDGIRKKNARFEIPAERNLYNIDQLIAQSNNENEVKELKQQKRLLRNRQAAYDSHSFGPCFLIGPKCPVLTLIQP